MNVTVFDPYPTCATVIPRGYVVSCFFCFYKRRRDTGLMLHHTFTCRRVEFKYYLKINLRHIFPEYLVSTSLYVRYETQYNDKLKPDPKILHYNYILLEIVSSYFLYSLLTIGNYCFYFWSIIFEWFIHTKLSIILGVAIYILFRQIYLYEAAVVHWVR